MSTPHGPWCNESPDTTHFDAIAPIYDATLPTHVASHYLEKRVRLLRGLIPAHSRVLDVGCGTGALAFRLQQESYRLVGVDRSAGMLAAAVEKRNVSVVQATADHLPFADEAFDAVVSIATLHHLGSPELVKAVIREMIRVVRHAGVAIVWDHNPRNPYWPVLMRRCPQDDGSERLVSLREINEAIQLCSRVRPIHYSLGFVPDFVPRSLLSSLQRLERWLERFTLTRWLAAHNVVVIQKS